MESCYVPNNPQFGISVEYTAYNGGFALCCGSLQPCACSDLELPAEPCCQDTPDCCQENQNLDILTRDPVDYDVNLNGDENVDPLDCGDVNPGEGSEVGGGACWSSDDMGSFSLPSLELEPLPSLFPFSPCSANYSNRSNSGECRERGGENAADVLLSLKHAVVHGECSTDPVHSQMMVNGGGSGYPYYEHYSATPLFPTMSVNVSMNMTMHGCPPDQLCSQMQWNQNPPTPSVNVVYPQTQNVISSSSYPSATYSFTADFRPPNQSDPLITATSSFKPLQLQSPQKSNGNYTIFPKQPNYSGHKTMSQSLKRPGQKIYVPESQKSVDQNMGGGYTIINHQGGVHTDEFGYASCVGSGGKVQVGALSGCSEDDDLKPNLCRICGKTYARPSTLKTHLRTHSGERPYRCGDCNKSFSQAANLTAHVRTHTGQKPFRCPICDRRFSQSSSVTTHMRTHSGERPYQCRSCKKAFSDSSTLTKHLRIHSGEKPYQCKLCLLRFSQSGNLNRHMRVHGNMGGSALLG